MINAGYATSVFLNCPFDEQYKPLRDAMVFAIYDCGFIPCCALQKNDSGDVRFEKIQLLIENSKLGIHDISRTELDENTHFPRFNMPLELGVFMGAKRFGDAQQKSKNILILDKQPYRYQAFISDIAGQDIMSHEADEQKIISAVRDWLSHESGQRKIHGGQRIRQRYESFREELPATANDAGLELNEITYNDYSEFISEWLDDNIDTTG